jgi:pimeloyl-ACP methyl ester carboxylesterase
MAADLHRFLDDNGIYQAHLLGHSMGGKTVMQFAADYPDRVHKLIVADMAPKSYPPHHEAILRALTTLNLDTLETRDQAEQHFIAAGIAGVGERQFLLKGLARDEHKRFFWRFNLPTLLRDYDEVLKNVTFHHPVECPTLFVHGGNSHYLEVADHAPILAHFPNAVFHTIPDAGHWLHAEKPEAFLQVVKDFLLLS